MIPPMVDSSKGCLVARYKPVGQNLEDDVFFANNIPTQKIVPNSLKYDEDDFPTNEDPAHILEER